jgi:large subunit ribosomal protein L10
VTLKLEDKKVIVEKLGEVLNSAISAVAADYRGLTVSEMTELRSKARANNIYMKIIRNTLARRAVKETQYACLEEALEGPIVLMFCQDEPGAAARLLRDFSKDHDALEVKALVLDGQLLGPDQLKAVAALPSRDEALAQLMSVLNAPITKFVRTCAEPYAGMARALGQIRDQKQA